MARRRRWWNVGVVKLPHAQRDVAHAVLGQRPGERWQDIVGADTPDDHDRFPVGSNCTYRAWLSDSEAERFRAASNCRYVHEDVVVSNVLANTAAAVPGWRVKAWLHADRTELTSLTGLGVKVAVLDCATAIAMRTYCNITMQVRGIFVTSTPPTNDGYPGFDHGSLAASTAIPAGGTLLDGVVVDDSNNSTDAIVAQGITWAVNNGAQVVNGSFSFASTSMPATHDALVAAASSDIIFFFALGNDATNYIAYPAYYGPTVPIPYLYGVGAYDMARDRLSTFSNWDATATGVAPGELVGCVTGTGVETTWYGTSASTPTVTRLAARLISGGVTARQAGAALAATVQDMGQSPFQCRGRFDMRRAANYLGIASPVTDSVDPNVFAASRPIPAVLP